MRDHPAGALQVAFMLDKVLPPKTAKKVEMEIYDYTGLRDLLSSLLASVAQAEPSLLPKISESGLLGENQQAKLGQQYQQMIMMQQQN